MAATDVQMEIAMKERKRGRTQQQAAEKYEGLGHLPSELCRPRTYQTRTNPFAQDWSEMAAKLAASPGL